MKNNLRDFPAEIRPDIASISENGGVLNAGRCKRICQQLSINIETLMIRLLPLAASYSKPLISDFQVGAVACGAKTDHDGMANLYLGANVEFACQALCYSVHAEQSAISNAWLHDEPGVKALATSAPPCGHCRQFLYEVAGSNPFPVLMPPTGASDLSSSAAGLLNCATGVSDSANSLSKSANSLSNSITSVDLSQLLPDAFGPLNLGCDRFLMDPGIGSNQLKLVNANEDDLVSKALHAANLSYAPYTLNYAGCALQLTNGNIFTGRYAENAAHNPSLTPFSAAFSKMVFGSTEIDQKKIARVVLVECPTKASQRSVTQNLVAAYTEEVELEYYSAVVAC